MLAAVGAASLDVLIDEAVPRDIRLEAPLRTPGPETEAEYLARLREIGGRNRPGRAYLGLGYYGCITPSVILRNVFENPGWYTPYTPYQAEAAQGRLEALMNYQTMIGDLTGMPVANASLLDEPTAAAEAMAMMHRVRSRTASGADRLVVSRHCFSQTIDVVRGRAEPLGIAVEVGDPATMPLDGGVFGVLLQTPAEDGAVLPIADAVARAHDAGALAAVCTDLLALTLLAPPGESGADIVVGNSQRFGVPMGYGGPHAAFFATREAFVRQMPGRIIGLSVDRHGDPAYRMALQTREQHIRRDRATSNICTAQALLANLAGFYAVYHGPDGLRGIAARVPPAGPAAGGGGAGAGSRAGAPAFLRHPHGAAAAGRGRSASGPGRRRRHALPLPRRRGGGHRSRRDHDPGRRVADRVADRGRPRPPRSVGPRRGPGCLSGLAGAARSHVGVPDPSGLPPAPVRDADDALSEAARAAGSGARHLNDSARLLHHEADRGVRHPRRQLAGVRGGPSVRAGGHDRRLPDPVPRARGVAGCHHRVAGGVPATELGGAGRIRRGSWSFEPGSAIREPAIETSS